MYRCRDKLIILDADGTAVDAFDVIQRTFSALGMEIGDLERFQKRRRLMKYLGGLKEFPLNLKKQLGKQSRKQLMDTLTEVYREQGRLFPGVADLIKTLLATPGMRVGIITRNITVDPEPTFRQLFLRHGIDSHEFQFLTCIPLRDEKTHHFTAARERLDINPARTYACGDEYKDYAAAIASGIQPFVVSYGFEDHQRLTKKFAVPEAVISRSPEEFCGRLRHALDLA
ncbi:MAG: HAD hydrolase-like protein [Rhodocyclaceae bacterium]|nr:HAD hydrolase-like protein [Rhodocyclaceae bacterium]